jgi:three-Cys-motif partner protein
VTQRQSELLEAANAVDTQPFFRSRRAAAVLKHAILSGYVVPFASKTGSSSVGHRVVLVDGYAGAGRYEDGQPGSPALLARAMGTPALAGRNVECYFIEQDHATFQQLCRVLREEDPDTRTGWVAREGSVEEHLPELLARADGVPLFLFLDPFGLGLPFDVVAGIFTSRPRGAYRPATEALIRVDAQAVYRTRGALQSSKDYPARAAQLQRLDQVAGGSWWRDENEPHRTTEAYLDWFMTRLLREMCQAALCWGWFTEVRQRGDLLPAYYLVFLTRHTAGLDEFAEALSRAQEKWRRAVFDEAVSAEDTQLIMFTPDEMFQAEERALADRWHDTLERNVRELLADKPSFIVRDEQSRVFAGVLGLARSKHLRVALKRLHNDGTTASDSTRDLWSKRVVAAQAT